MQEAKPRELPATRGVATSRSPLRMDGRFLLRQHLLRQQDGGVEVRPPLCGAAEDALHFFLVVGNLAPDHLTRFAHECPVVIPLAHALDRQRDQDAGGDRDELDDEILERVCGGVRRVNLHGLSLRGQVTWFVTRLDGLRVGHIGRHSQEGNLVHRRANADQRTANSGDDDET